MTISRITPRPSHPPSTDCAESSPRSAIVAIAPPSRAACPATPNGDTVSPTSARFLMTTPFSGLSTGPGGELAKAVEARRAIEQALGKSGGSDSVLKRFMREVLDREGKDKGGEKRKGMVDTFEKGVH